MKEVMKLYLSCLEKGDYDQLISLFSDSAVVFSPLYGKQDAKAFYKNLFADTIDSKITLLNLFVDEESHKAAVHFYYEWILKNGVSAPFEVVDIVEFNLQMQISSLKIIYDSQQTREKYNAATSN